MIPTIDELYTELRDIARCETMFTPVGLQDKERCESLATHFCENCDEYVCERCSHHRHVGMGCADLKEIEVRITFKK